MAIASFTYAGQLVNLLGRRGALLLSSAWFAAGWLFIIFGGPTIILLFVGRFLTGFGMGMVALAVPVFISEICPSGVRGLLNTGGNMILTMGILATFVVGKWLDYKWLAICCLAPSIAMAATLPWSKESPRWLLQKGRRKEATEALQFYLGTGIEKELETLEASINNLEVFSLRDLTLPHVYKPFLCTLLPMFMQQFSAVCIILFFANDIFAAAGTTISPEDCTIIVGAIQVVILFVATLLADRLGRKILLLVSSAAASLSLVLLGLCFYFKKTQGDAFLESYGWLPLASLSLYFVGYSMGLGPLPWVLLGEMLPLRVKGFATGICTAFCFGCGFLVVKEYHDMQVLMGTDGTYWMFAVILAACFFVVLFCVPETKGKSLEEIEHLFGKASSSGSLDYTDRNNGVALDLLHA